MSIFSRAELLESYVYISVNFSRYSSILTRICLSVFRKLENWFHV